MYPGAALNVAAPGVLTNDTDADGNSLTAQLGTGPSNGTLTLNSNGSFTYTPNANFNGSDSFTYRASDGTTTSNLATVSTTVNSVVDTETFSFTGAQQNFTVPAGVTSITVEAWGAEGGDGNDEGGAGVPGAGANGGKVTATITVTPGETLAIFVGGQGAAATTVGQDSTGGTGGFNGGAAGGGDGDPPTSASGAGGGGGGASDVRRGGTALTDRVVVAGGGGGAVGVLSSTQVARAGPEATRQEQLAVVAQMVLLVVGVGLRPPVAPGGRAPLTPTAPPAAPVPAALAALVRLIPARVARVATSAAAVAKRERRKTALVVARRSQRARPPA